ncbi:transposase [Rhizobacter sp. OV335]|jgi:hypothetical protein|uniref:IS66 family transposase n=1 Tax=Rhizobacter sp. OV335 TaxID=1500264 RepID=UPI000916EDF2|nr:Transposase IS66 family protein [Rhizobacter sp. OV335]
MVGSCGGQLLSLVDALKAQMLAHRVLHADETPVPMLDPGSGKTHRAYLWSYCTRQFESDKIVAYDCRRLVHARRKFYELWTNHSSHIAEGR